MDQKVNLIKFGWAVMFFIHINIRTRSIFVPSALVASVRWAIPMSKIISLTHENV